MVDLSVIIVSYNTRDHLLRCVDSVIVSLEKADVAGRDARIIGKGYEIIVVDNASEDGSVAALQHYFPEVGIVQNEVNRGFAAACNQGMRVSRGRLTLLLNPDTYIIDRAILELMRFLDQHPRAGVVTGKLLNADGSLQHSAFRFPGLWSTLLDFFPVSYRLSQSKLNGRYPLSAYRASFEIDHPLGACMLVRREAVERVGPLSEDFFMYGEEVDWCLRIKQDNWRIYCQPQAEIVHLGGQSTGQQPDRMYVELFRSRLILFRKHYNPFFRVAAKAIIGLGMWWEFSKVHQRYLAGRVSRDRYLNRRNACRQVFSLLRTHG